MKSPPKGLLCLAIAIVFATVDLWAQTKSTWDKVQYLGGAPGVQGTSETWKNELTVSPQTVTLKLASGRLIQIDSKDVTAVTYSGNRMIRQDLAENLSNFFYLTAKSTSHFIGIEFLLSDGRTSGILLRADKSNFQEITNALRALPHLTPVAK